MIEGLRRVGVAIGSLVAAWLVVSLLGTPLGLRGDMAGPIATIVTFVLGGLIYAEIMRQDAVSGRA